MFNHYIGLSKLLFNSSRDNQIAVCQKTKEPFKILKGSFVYFFCNLSRRKFLSSGILTLTCSQVSRSRTVTALSSSDS